MQTLIDGQKQFPIYMGFKNLNRNKKNGKDFKKEKGRSI